MADKSNSEKDDGLDINEDDLEDDGGSPIPAEVEICERYFDLLQDEMVRIAISGVVVAEGRISSSKTRQKLQSWFEERGFQSFERSHLRIMTFLNSVWFVGCENLSEEFWWTHKNMILKLVYVALVAEAANLQMYGASAPSVKHLPRSALFLYDYISTLDDEAFTELEAEFKALAETHEDFCGVFMKMFKEPERTGRSKTVEAKASKPGKAPKKK